MKDLILFLDKNGDRNKAEFLAEKLNINIFTRENIILDSDLVLKVDEKGLSLRNKNMVLFGDFIKMKNRIKSPNLQAELLVKASKIKSKNESLSAIDATAGMGEDSFLLAASGFTVYLFEKNPIIVELLKDALERAENDFLLSDIVKRMKVIEDDSIISMSKMNINPDVIVLDPMFPERTKSALIKKKFQILQQLELPCSDEHELLEAAINLNPRKVIIKRPLKGEFLDNRKPSYSIKGKSIRYDIIVI